MFKKGFTLVELLAIIVILAVIALIATPIVKDSIANSKEQALKETINSIERAAYNYGYQNDIGYDTNYKKLTLDELISKGFLKGDIINPVTNEKMNGCVLYRWNETNNQYEFKYNEECPKYPESLITVLLEQYNESNTTGLVKDSTNENLYYYTGTNEEVGNNFLWYGGHFWRVLEFDTSENSVTLITQQPLTSIAPIEPSTSAWETQEAYESSYINQWLNDYFWNSLDSSIQNNILDTTFNVGPYDNVSEITTTQKVGLLDFEYCEKIQLYGSADYLSITDGFWLGNRYSSTEVGLFDLTHYDSGDIYDSYGVRPVIKISNIPIDGGDGSFTNAYYKSSKSTSTNDVQVGEYINVPYSGSDNNCGEDNVCTFRVVSKDSDSIKVVLNGVLANTSQYGNSATISQNHTIYTVLNNFASNISSIYRYTGNKILYIGEYSGYTNYNYKDVQNETMKANIGLPTIGEMFSGNDIDMGDTKTFVDVNTIENPNVSVLYWTMNRNGEYNVNTVSDNGRMEISSPSWDYPSVRPTIYLKNDLDFISGEGTAQNPYTLQ